MLFMSCHHSLLGEYQQFGEECCLLLRAVKVIRMNKTQNRGWWRGKRIRPGSTGRLQRKCKELLWGWKHRDSTVSQPRQNSLYADRCDSLRIWRAGCKPHSLTLNLANFNAFLQATATRFSYKTGTRVAEGSSQCSVSLSQKRFRRVNTAAKSAS